MNREEIISSGLLELYATGAASPQEQAQVEQWLAEYPELVPELRSIEASLEDYARNFAIDPPPQIKAQVLEKIRRPAAPVSTAKENRHPATTRLRIPLFYRVAAAAMLLLLLGSLALVYVFYNRFRETRDQLAGISNQLHQANDQLRQQDQANASMQHELDLVGDRNALPVVLNGTPQAPDALAKIYWMKNNGDIYIDPTNLPPAPEGKQYQFWAIIDGKPVDGGMIRTSKGIYHIQKMKSFGHADAFAITLEKEGGSPVPHGEMYAMAKIL